MCIYSICSTPLNCHGPVQLWGLVQVLYILHIHQVIFIQPTHHFHHPSIPQVFEHVQAFATIKQSTGISDIAERAFLMGGQGCQSCEANLTVNGKGGR